MNAVRIDGISKSYAKGKIKALQNIDLSIRGGELFGLIGPDGAGKTTLFRILTTLLLPDAGQARVGALDVVGDFKKIRQQVGYMPGRFSLYQDLSVEENLQFFATLFGTTLRENYDLIKDIYIQIEPFRKRRAGKLSGGMKQKLALCCALIHRPQVLFLDEPTTGVDAVSRKEFWEMLQRLKQEGITILVSTPYMDEATLCERIALIQNGKIMSVNTPAEITAAFPKTLFSVRSDQMPALLDLLRSHQEVESCFAFGDTHHLILKNPSQETQTRILQYLEASNHREVSIDVIDPTIEDCFIYLMRDYAA